MWSRTVAKLSCVIFDWAGTTVDFGSFSPVAAFREAFKSNGLEVTDAQIRAPMGMLKRDHIRTMLAMDEIKSAFESLRGHSPADPDIDAIYSVFEPSLLKVLPECSALKPFVPECMDYLRRYGIKIGSTTGYTAKMMDVVVPCARDLGYSPDCLVTPDEVGGRGRPYPYMIFENLRRLDIQDTRGVAKIGDTVSDIEEGLNAGLFTVGVTEGSSVMGLSESEFSALSEKEREEAHLRAAERFFTEGANLVIRNLGEISLVKAAVEAR